MNLKIGQLRLASLRNRQEKKMKKNEQSLRDLWDSIKCINICIIAVSEKEERGREVGAGEEQEGYVKKNG